MGAEPRAFVYRYQRHFREREDRYASAEGGLLAAYGDVRNGHASPVAILREGEVLFDEQAIRDWIFAQDW